jgi:hypothetical protein
MNMPVKPSEAAALADLVFQELEARSLNDETRGRIASRLSGLGLSAIQPHIGSLARDPVHASAYYLAADTIGEQDRTSVLLRLSLASSSSSELFRDPVLIGRMRPGGGREVIVTAIPFAARDHENIRIFIERVDTSFQPRPHGAQAAIVVASAQPEQAFPAAFDAWRGILKRTGWNPAALAYTGAAGEGSSNDVWHSAVQAAIRSGWREGYTVEAQHLSVGEDGLNENVQRAIVEAALYSEFRVDASRLFDYRADHRTRHGWSEPDIEGLYEETLAPEIRSWIEAEYRSPFEMGAVTHRLAPHEVRRLAVKFGHSLLCFERFYDVIAQSKSGVPAWARRFDYEPSFLRAETITRGKELTFCLHWLKARGRPAQSVVPNLAFRNGEPYPETTEQQLDYIRGESWDEIAEATGVVFPGKPLDELAQRVSELSAIARHFGATLTIEALGGKQPAVLQLLGHSASGRVNLNVRLDLPGEAGDTRAAAHQIVSTAENLRS